MYIYAGDLVRPCFLLSNAFTNSTAGLQPIAPGNFFAFTELVSTFLGFKRYLHFSLCAQLGPIALEHLHSKSGFILFPFILYSAFAAHFTFIVHFTSSQMGCVLSLDNCSDLDAAGFNTHSVHSWHVPVETDF